MFVCRLMQLFKRCKIKRHFPYTAALWIHFPEPLKHAPMPSCWNLLPPSSLSSLLPPLRFCAQPWCRKKCKYLLPPICHLRFHRGVAYQTKNLWLLFYNIEGIELLGQAAWDRWTLGQVHTLKSIESLRTGMLPGKMCSLSLSTSIIGLNIWKKKLPDGHKPVNKLPVLRRQLLSQISSGITVISRRWGPV